MSFYDSWVQLSNVKLQLVKEKLMFKIKVNLLEQKEKMELIWEKLHVSEKQITEKKLQLVQEEFKTYKEKIVLL